VDAVVVARAEVEGGEFAVVKPQGEVPVAAEQGGGGIAVALGLEDLVALDAPELADGAVDRAEVVGIRQRAGARFERPGEEFVEARVAGNVRVGGFGHVDAVAPDEPADHAGGESAGPGAGELAGQHGERLLGDQVLGQNGEAVGHGGNPGGRRRGGL